MSSDLRRIGRFGLWGALAGLVGSLCCLGPSAALLLGLGASSVLFGMRLAQAPALLAGGLLLGAGVLWALRPCRSCAPRHRALWRSLAAVLAAGALSYALLGLLAPALAARSEAAPGVDLPVPAPGPAPAGHERRLTLIVEKMICPPCASAIRRRLGRLDGVRALQAEPYNEQVVIAYDSRLLDQDDLLARLPPDAGVTVVSDE